MVELKQSQTVIALKTKLETGRRRAEAAEARNAELERLNKEKGLKTGELEERLSLTRSASITLKRLVFVLQKLRDAEIKHVLSARIQQQTARADGAEAKCDALNARKEQLEAEYDAARKERKELSELFAELNI